ncbi:MAG: hypothetical protein DUD39_13820 [Coriobacteriaceae bacterium]|nr:MAG: hypothetical protein DUD39_13820 [Coriobacteriaceae bacterium]
MINAYAGHERPRGWSFLTHHWELIIVSLKTSLVVLYFRTFLALSQISSTACCTSSFVTLLKSLPLGEELAQEPVGVLNC